MSTDYLRHDIDVKNEIEYYYAPNYNAFYPKASTYAHNPDN